MGDIPLFNRWNLIIAVGLGAMIISCSPPKPIRIGFVGGLSFDDFGDAQRETFITTISGGQFIVAE